MVPELINAGYVYVATDYEGLGTPGMHRYGIGTSEGRGVLDIVRAAQQIEEAHVGDRTVLWGLSQGGHAILFAAEMAPAWAPDIEVLGAVAAAPGSTEVDSLLDDLAAELPDVRGFVWMATLSYEDAYPELSLEDLYDAQTIATIRDLDDQEACWMPFGAAAADVENAGFLTNPTELPEWRERLLENSPGHTRTETPTLILQGSADTVVPQWQTDPFVERLCNIESPNDYRVFEGYNHVQSLTLNLPLALEWTAARFAGEPAADTCPE
jgi:pimeloyl-ACP methyl ester carboxylesterase